MSIQQNNFILKLNLNIRLSDLVAFLISSNYQRSKTVKYFGQFNDIGERIIIYPVNMPQKATIDFIGNVVDSIIVDSPEKELINELIIAPNIIDDDGLRFEPGQYVVHLDHGIGLFKTLGMREINSFADKTQSISRISKNKQAQPWRPFLILEYANATE